MMRTSEKKFTPGIGVLFRRFFQCTIQPHIIWAVTEWNTEKHHNDAAQSLMKTRRDDRIASILFGPGPYFEIFCNEALRLRVGEYSDKWRFVIVAHGLVNARAGAKLLRLQRDRVLIVADRIDWLRLYHNRYHPDEFVAFLGFRDEKTFHAVCDVEGFRLEEYLLTGLRNPLGMSYLAGYNQFICSPLSLFSKKP
ncbi:MAG: hypothetical protein HYU64_01660 [Armatimonadetes bacterium]|nr:hypothetical protein [Armatimonadota bacterium]